MAIVTKYGKMKLTTISIPESMYLEGERRAKYESFSSHVRRALDFYHSRTNEDGTIVVNIKENS